MTNSPEQDTILNAVRTTSANLIIEACPGSGKTTTLALIARTLPQDGSRHVALAFGKDNAEDFKTKLPYWIESSTCHSLCKSAIDKSWGRRPKVDKDKCKWLLKDNFDVDWKRHADLLKAVSLVKQQAETLSEVEVEELCDRHGVELLSGEPSTLQALLALSDSDHSRIDFDDMLRFAGLRTDVRFPRFATVMVDEGQDTNGIQREVLAKIVAPTIEQRPVILNDPQYNGIPTFRPRIIIVGDPNQAIFAFRGADAHALDALRDRFACDTLSLSTSWRCSKAVCEEANRILEKMI